MKTKKLFLCLLFLVMGTTAWADKYYQPGSYRGNTMPRLTLSQAVGKKFFIYNTAIDGNVDRTGFLRNNGVQFEHDKTKERDLFIYNESFVYTMEAYDDTQDGNPDWYAIKSVQTGLYVNINGKTDVAKATDAKLYITDWDNATNKAGVNMENWKYNIVANAQITSSGNGSTVFVVKYVDDKGTTTCWNGDVDAFATWSTGHPYAFYEAHEFTNDGADYEYLEDLHIYSRCDIFSAQVIYGYIKSASQITSNYGFENEGAFANLLDADATTYNVTNWGVNAADDYHYYQIDLGESTDALYLYMQRRADGKNAPTKYELQVCATADGQFVTVGGERETTLAGNNIYSSDKIELGGSYRYIRIVAKETTTTNYMCMGLSELYVLPNRQEIKDAIEYIAMANEDNIYTRATARQYNDFVEKYNSTCPDAKLLSGVPLPGNKYRIYADAFDTNAGVYVNREIMAGSSSLEIKAAGSYHEAVETDGAGVHTEHSKYEWYCELTADGYLTFRNVGNMNLYLGNGIVTEEPYKWSMSTLGTQRHGVPLMNFAQQYLALYNDGTHWMGNVKAPQDQTRSNASIDDDNNAETPAQIVEPGLCTDFVFIPVPLEGNEKKVTITGNELVKRNTKLLFDANNDKVKEVHPLPYSRMFVTAEKFATLELQLLCNDIHEYKGIRVNDEETPRTDIATIEDNVLTFDFTKVNDGDVLNIELEIKKPFEVMDGKLDVAQKPALYLIRNKRQFGLAQQARPNRAGVNIEIGGGDSDSDGEVDGPISSQTGKSYYAKFSQRDADMDLLEGSPEIKELTVSDLAKITGIDAASLFYFTETEDADTEEYYSVNINNVTTVMKCADRAAWNTNGNIWSVQPKKVGNYTGYNIGRTKLKATNNPADAWCSNHDDGGKIVVYNANDEGTAWEFVPVGDEAAKKLLKEFIDKVATELNAKLNEKMLVSGIDKERVEYYRFVANTMADRAGYFVDPDTYEGDFSDTTSEPIAKLLQFAQNIHMLEHEVEYSLYEFPDLSKDIVKKLSELNNYEQPHWYYIRNVKGTADAGKDSYATFTADEEAMALQQYAADEGKKLANLFYFVGEKNSYGYIANNDASDDAKYKDYPGNNLIIDEYLKAHIHNFMAKEVTLVSRNVLLTEKTNITPGYGQQTVATGLNLKGNENWSVELEYDLAGNTSFNAYGSCLLASTKDPLGDNYAGGFQVYLKDDRSIVIKCNNDNDTYRFWHTQDNFSHIKVVITYSQNKVTLDVYNSLGVKETIHVPDAVTLNDITEMTTALPAEGAVITRLATYQVEAMTWKTHEDVQNMVNKDEWFILPSSNTVYPGLAIVLGEPCDTRMGWTNDQGENKFVGNDLGVEDNSTWVFERVTDFDDHVDELLEMYNYENCVIYDKDIARLYALILEKSTFIKGGESREGEEEAFNQLYYAFLNYKGRTAAELKAPKPGCLYTIRPMAEENTANALVVHVDNKGDGAYATKEVYNGAVVREDDSYDPRGVWVFEGSAGQDGFLALNGLTVKNLHTQCYLTALGADASAVNEGDAAQVTLGTIGGCITKFQVGGQYMNRTTVTPTLSYDRTREFWGGAVTTYPAGVKDQITLARLGDGTVRCKRLDVEVKTEGEESSKNVVVTFKYDEGSHKINILGVELLGNNGEMLYADYHYGRAGGELVGNIYTIEGVVAGAYTMNCYVFEPNGNGADELTNHKGHFTIEGVAEYSGEGKIINTGTEATKWIVEEILDPENEVYYETTIEEGYSTLMLGFDAKIPEGVEAYTGAIDGIIVDKKYLSMTQCKESILAANTPVVLRSSEEGVAKTAKFYLSVIAGKQTVDNYLRGSLYYTVVSTDKIEDEVGASINIYMLQSGKTGPRMYWIYEEYDKSGNLVDGGNNDNGKHVLCKANKAYIVIKSGEANGKGSFMFMLNRGGATGIDDVEDEVETIETIYDLQGRRLDEITHPGVYIVNGRKIVVK